MSYMHIYHPKLNERCTLYSCSNTEPSAFPAPSALSTLPHTHSLVTEHPLRPRTHIVACIVRKKIRRNSGTYPSPTTTHLIACMLALFLPYTLIIHLRLSIASKRLIHELDTPLRLVSYKYGTHNAHKRNC